MPHKDTLRVPLNPSKSYCESARVLGGHLCARYLAVANGKREKEENGKGKTERTRKERKETGPWRFLTRD